MIIKEPDYKSRTKICGKCNVEKDLKTSFGLLGPNGKKKRNSLYKNKCLECCARYQRERADRLRRKRGAALIPQRGPERKYK